MRKWAFGSVLMALAAVTDAGHAAAQTATAAPLAPVEYDVRLDNAAHHEAHITVTYRALPPGPVRFQMARSSPGRYAIHEFAKNVYAVSAKDGAGRALALTRTDPYGWSVPSHDGTIAVSYTLYGDHGDGTYTQIDSSHAHLNMPATLLWAVGQHARAVRIRFTAADPSWKVATQLRAEPDGSWSAPNLQYLMDSPTELSDHMLREWPVAGGQTVRIALHHQGSAADADRFAEMAKKVVAEQYRLWGGPPRYDVGSYTFIADYLPWISGDGMEHRNSTIISDPRSLAAADFAQIQTLSHEFFHQWNVERLRPAELEPFDFTRANPTPSLWFAEGFTNYYGPLTVRRAGLVSVDDFVKATGTTLPAILNNPARRYGGPQEMSLRAAFNDAARAIDPVNPNIFASYYPYGQIVALALDLTLRQRFPGVTLDDYMRHLWRSHGATERPYTNDDLRRALGEVTRDPAFADDFFARSIAGSDLPDMAPLLAQAGLVLRPAAPGRGWPGAVTVKQEDAAVTLAAGPAPNTPLYVAGVERGDTLVSLGGTAIASTADWTRAIDSLVPGATTDIVFRQRGQERRARLAAVANPTQELVRIEATGARPSAAQRRFRTAWLGAE